MCNLCQLARGDESQHVTDWYFLGLPGCVPERFEGIVVRDQDDKGYAKRLLWVPRAHIPVGEETGEMRLAAHVILRAVAYAVAVNDNLVVSGFDFNKHSNKDHWHAQIHLDFPEEIPVGLLR